MRVVKIGGSLYQHAELKLWLAQLSKQSQHTPIIIVPGGGPFAYTVREAQKQYDFDDSAAHYMAILAMSQFGVMLASLEDSLDYFTYPSQQSIPPFSVWLPDKALLNIAALPHSWDVTSDSLSLWLSQQLNAEALDLVKCDKPKHQTIEGLIQQGLLDKAFLSFYQQQAITTRIFTHTQAHHFPHQGHEVSI